MVRLLKRTELPEDWDPKTDTRLTVWEATQHLIKRLETNGEQAAADLVRNLDRKAEAARDLAYRLYTTCERKGWAEEARAYNGLVIAWPELMNLASNAVQAMEDAPELERKLLSEAAQFLLREGVFARGNWRLMAVQTALRAVERHPALSITKDARDF